MRIRINNTLRCEVCNKNSSCIEQLAHCHVIREGVRVALVWLEPIRIQPGHSLEVSDCRDIIRVVSCNKYFLKSLYDYTET